MAEIGENKHPLLIPYILECIFNKLGVSDLKTCRQVNRLWHQEATVAMRSAVKVKLESKSEEPSVNGGKMMDFLELIQSELSTFSSLPIANTYDLWGVRMDVPEFWAFCGSSIRNLIFFNVSLDSAHIFRHIIFQSCPNLEKLELHIFKISGSTVQGSIAKELPAWVQPRFPQNMNLKRLKLRNVQLGEISYLELLSYFPSLEEIVSHREDASEMFQALATCRENDPQCWNIKRISFFIKRLRQPESDLRFLLDGSLSLETLDVSEVRKSEHAGVLKNILSAHTTTLNSLKVNVEKTGEILGETMLEKLMHFSLFSAKITSLSFLRIMPHLKKLELISCKFSLESEWSDEPLNHWVNNSCTDLSVYDRPSIDLIKMFRRIPNVKKLRISDCDNELFAGICELFPNLVCLELMNSKMDDCGISGLDKEDVRRINEDGNLVRRSVTVPKPNLSSLKNLKWFSYKPLYTWHRRTGNALGFCAALCGIQQLPQLQHLKVEGSSEPIWDRLCDQYQWKDP